MTEITAHPHGIKLPKTELGQAKMDKIVEAAIHLFTEVGFYETSVADICRKAGTAVGTFYIYFETKRDLYRHLLDKYKVAIRTRLAKSIRETATREEAEREGIRTFIKYAVEDPMMYNIIWGSLSIDQVLFVDYYVSFAESYAKALAKSGSELAIADTTSLAYLLMGLTNFLGLHAIFEGMDDDAIDKMIDTTVMPALREGIFRKKAI